MTKSKHPHSYWMNRALVLARQGFGRVHPNPMVGAIVLNVNGEVVGRGYHEKYGGDHAEVVALRQAGEKAKGGTLYVTLEPCCHFGKTPPCVQAVIASGIKTVVAASVDPNPKVSGKGFEELKKNHIDVVVGVEQQKALRLNEPFAHWMKHERPFVRAKVAMTIEGVMGHQDQRLLLSSRILEKTTMKFRADAQAIVIGVNTVITDQPRLNVRGPHKNIQPIRVIIDSTLRIPLTSEIFEVKEGGDVWIFCDEQTRDSKKWKSLSMMAKVIGLPTVDGKMDMSEVVRHLGEHGIRSILVEGGATTLQSFYEKKLIDAWIIYLNSRNLKKDFPKNKLIGITQNPLFSLEYQSVIRAGFDLLIVGQPR